MELINDIREDVKKKKPKLSTQSIITYSSILKSLYTHVFPNEKYKEDKFDETETILKFLKDLEPNKRKTILSALVAITGKKEYRDMMLKDIEKYTEKEHTQEKSEKQIDSWVSGDTVREVFNKLQSDANIIYKKEKFKMSDLQEIQDYIIMAILGGLYIPPRRSKDYVNFKISDIDKDEDNYMVKNSFVFNSYKTAKTYGKQVVEIPVELKKIITKWIRLNPTEYLLFDSNRNQLSNVKLTQRLNKLFGKKVSVNQLRHSYLSDKYQSTIDINKALEKDMQEMGSSTKQQKVYIKSIDV